MLKVLAIISILGATACSSTDRKESPIVPITKESYQQDIKRLEQSLNKQAQIVDQLREENQRLKLSKSLPSLKTTSSRTTASEETARDLGENKLFSAFLSAHNSGRTKKARRAFYLMEKTYPNSSLLAEAIYLLGKKDIENARYKASLRKMNRLLEEFSRHPRSRSAMLAKSVIYRRLNLARPAKSVLKDLISKYPKSMEAKKAKSYLALMESKSKGN